MPSFKLDMSLDLLDAWGSPEGSGSTTVEGPIQVAVKLLFGALDTAISDGLYSAIQRTYRVTYSLREDAMLLDRELAIADESSGNSWIIAKGTFARRRSAGVIWP